jgi:hypothetical protein
MTKQSPDILPESEPDFIEEGRRRFGCAALPFAKVPAEIGVSISYAWKLVKEGQLQLVYLSDRKPIVRTDELARLLWERRRNPKKRQPSNALVNPQPVRRKS